jgi:hypothetical protein
VDAEIAAELGKEPDSCDPGQDYNADGICADSGSTDTGPSASTSPEDNPSCESSGGSLAWLMCPVVMALQGGVNLVMGYIDDQLNYQSLNDKNGYIKETWGKFIPIANIGLAVV